MSHDQSLRDQLVAMLKGGHAHITFDKTVEHFPLDRIGVRPPGMPHSAWELLEHIRIAQNDILKFSESADHVSPEWPGGYWPASPAPGDAKDWGKSVRSFRADLTAFEKLVQDPKRDLFEPFPRGEGQTLLREAILIVDHNSYHLGQLLLVRRVLEQAKS